MNAPGKSVSLSKKQRVSLIEEFAGKFGVEPTKVMPILRATCFKVRKGDPPATDEEIAALMIVAREYNLNPFTRELFAFRGKDGSIVPIIGYDGWIRIVEAQPSYDGHDMVCGFDETPGPDNKELGFYFECTMHRKDRSHAIRRRLYYRENARDTDPWNKSPTRMLTIRAYIQTARAAFGLGGIYDEDEGEVIALRPGVDLLPASRTHVEPPQARTAEEPVATEDQLEMLREKLGVCGVQESLVLAKFEVGTLEDLKAAQVPTVLKFISDNGGPPE